MLKKFILLILTVSIWIMSFATCTYAETENVTFLKTYSLNENQQNITLSITPQSDMFCNISLDTLGSFSAFHFLFEDFPIELKSGGKSYSYFSRRSLSNSEMTVQYYLSAGEDYTFTLSRFYENSKYYNLNYTFSDVTADTNIMGNLQTGENIISEQGLYLFIPDKTGHILLDAPEEEFNSDDYKKFYLYNSGSSDEGTQMLSSHWLLESTKGKPVLFEFPQGTYTLTIQNTAYADNTPVVTSSIIDMQTSHPFECNLDKKWTYIAPQDTAYMSVTFDEKCDTSYATLYIYDASGTQVFYNYYNDLAGKTLNITGSSFTITLQTGTSHVNYGFKVSDIKCYTSAPTPEINRPTGLTRPFLAELSTLSSSEIYYKLSGMGDYQLYTKPFIIEKDSIVCAYAVTNGVQSEKVFFHYEIDNSPVPAPEITVVSETDETTTLSFSAEDGIIFYRTLNDSSVYNEYEYTAGQTVTITDAIEVYAICGNKKSESVFYVNNKSKSDVVDEHTPVITITPVMGGKKVTISVPDELSFDATYDEYGYVEDHPPSMCMQSGYEHDSTWYSIVENLWLEVYMASEGQGKILLYGFKDELAEGIVLTSDTAIVAEILQTRTENYGYWITDEGNTHYKSINDNASKSISYERDNDAVLVEVPKAEAPVVKASLGKATIVQADGLTVYYSINGGDFQEYTGQFLVSPGDVIRAYSEGLGVSKSDETVYRFTSSSGVTGSAAPQKVTTGFTGTPSVSNCSVDNISLTLNATSEISGATLLLAAYDTETKDFAGALSQNISLTKGDNLLENLSIPLSKSYDNVYIRAFIWNMESSHKPYGADELTIIE